MAYDERVARERAHIIEQTTKQYGEETAKGMAAAMRVEDEMADTLRALVRNALEPAQGHEEALMLAKLAVAEAISTVYGEAAVDAYCSSNAFRKKEVNEMELISMGVRSAAGNVQLAYANHTTAKNGIEDMIASARA